MIGGDLQRINLSTQKFKKMDLFKVFNSITFRT